MMAMKHLPIRNGTFTVKRSRLTGKTIINEPMSGTHYYHPKTLELIDGDLRAARKVGGLPSPTTVLRILSSPGLQWYFKRQMWEATCTTPRLPSMGDEEHFKACMKWADEHGQSARDRGGDFHDLAQQFHAAMKGGHEFACPFHSLQPHFEAYRAWYRATVKESVAVELPVLGQGYAGRLDHLALLLEPMITVPRTAVMDVKTQDISKTGRFNFYPEWAIQLGAYAGALTTPPDMIVSVCVSANFPIQVEAHVWPNPPAYYHGLFLGLLNYWKFANNY